MEEGRESEDYQSGIAALFKSANSQTSDIMHPLVQEHHDENHLE